MKPTAFLLMAALLASCGGGGSSPIPAQSNTGASKGVAIHLSFPAPKSTQVRGSRRPDYVPINTRGMGIDFVNTGGVFTPAGTTPNPNPMIGSALVAGAGACGAAHPDGSYDCEIYIPNIAPGYYDFKVTLYSVPPTVCTYPAVSGCTFDTTKALSTTIIGDQAVKSGQLNQFNFGFNSVVDSVYVSLNKGIVDGTASTVTATVTAKDVNGFIILNSPQFVGANSNNLTLSLTFSNNCNGSLTFTAPSATPQYTGVGAGSNQATIAYNGANQCASNGTTQPAVTVGLSGDTIAGTALGAYVSVTQTAPNGVGVPSAPQVASVGTALTNVPNGVTLGSDGNLWVSEGNKIAKVTTGGVVTETTTPSGGNAAGAILGAPDGDVWYWDSVANVLDRFAPASFPTIQSSAALPQQNAQTVIVNGLAMGRDGIIYAADSGNQVVLGVNPNALSTVASVEDPGDFGLGPDNTIEVATGPSAVVPFCIADGFFNVNCYSTAGPGFAGSVVAFNTPTAIVLGPDNQVYVGEIGTLDQVGVDPTSGSLLPNCGPCYVIPSGYTVTGMAVGSDGNVWFVENNGNIGKITPGSSIGPQGNVNGQGALQEYAPSVTGIAAGASPQGLVAGPAGSNKLYFLDTAHNQVDSITY